MNVEEIICSAVNNIGVGKKTFRSRYLEITEGRDDWTDSSGEHHTYQWCGDFITRLLYFHGCTDPRWINRVEAAGMWVPGDNLVRLEMRARETGLWFEDPTALRRGDIYLTNRDSGGHIGLVEHVIEDQITTIDGNSYGGVVARNNRVLEGHRIHLFRGAIRTRDIPGGRDVSPWSSALAELIAKEAALPIEGEPLPAEYS